MSAFLDGYIQLAHAIVAVAAESYKYTLLAVKNHTRSDSVFRRKEELESFFLSEWFGLLSGLDGRYFIVRRNDDGQFFFLIADERHVAVLRDEKGIVFRRKDEFVLLALRIRHRKLIAVGERKFESSFRVDFNLRKLSGDRIPG